MWLSLINPVIDWLTDLPEPSHHAFLKQYLFSLQIIREQLIFSKFD